MSTPEGAGSATDDPPADGEVETFEDFGGEDTTWPTASPRWWWGWAALALSLIGVGISLYLTIDHFRGTVPICSATGIVDCAKVTTSPQSEVFGVLPVALLGLIFYTALAVVNLPPLWRVRGLPGRVVTYGRLAMVITGIGMVIYLIYTELFTIKAICLWCTGVHVVTFLLFVLVVSTMSSMAMYTEDTGA